MLVVSAAAVGKEWLQEEFAGAMAGVVGGSQRLVPVLLDDVPLPPFAAARVYVDFHSLVTGPTVAALLQGVPMLLTSMPPSIARYVPRDGFTVHCQRKPGCRGWYS